MEGVVCLPVAKHGYCASLNKGWIIVQQKEAAA
jgi:hypothetical protein